MNKLISCPAILMAFLFSSLNLNSADGGASLTWIIPAVQSIGTLIAAAMGAKVSSRNFNPYGGAFGAPDGMADMESVRVAMHQKAAMPALENRGIPVGLQSPGYHEDTRGRGMPISQNKAGGEGVKIYFTAEDQEIFHQERQREHTAESEARSKAACDNAEKQWNQLKAENKKRGIKRPKNAKPYYMDSSWTIEKYRAHLDAGGDPEAYLSAAAEREKEKRQKALAEIDRQQKESFAKMKQKVIHTAAETIVVVGKMEGADATKTTTVEAIPFLFPAQHTQDMIEQKLDALLQENNQQPKIDLTPNNNNQIPNDGGDKDPQKGPNPLETTAGVYGAKKVKEHVQGHGESHTNPKTEKSLADHKNHEQKIYDDAQKRLKAERKAERAKLNNDRQPFHEKGIEAKFPDNPGQKDHMFADRPGHIKERTPNSEKVVLDTVEAGNFKRIDDFGNSLYARTHPDGNQIWVEVRPNGTIKNCGANEANFHCSLNPTTGRWEKPSGFPETGPGIAYVVGAGFLGGAMAGSEAKASEPASNFKLSNATLEKLGIKTEVVDRIKNDPNPLQLPSAPKESFSNTVETSPEMKAMVQHRLDSMKSLPAQEQFKEAMKPMVSAPKLSLPSGTTLPTKSGPTALPVLSGSAPKASPSAETVIAHHKASSSSSSSKTTNLPSASRSSSSSSSKSSNSSSGYRSSSNSSAYKSSSSSGYKPSSGSGSGYRPSASPSGFGGSSSSGFGTGFGKRN